MEIIKKLTNSKVTHKFLNGNHSVICLDFLSIELIILPFQFTPKQVEKQAFLNNKTSMHPEQVRSTIHTDQRNLFAFCSDCKKCI